MNKEGITKIIKTIQTGVVKHSPEILTGLGIAGMISTTILAVKATPKAMRLIDEAKEMKKATPNDIPKLTNAEIVKVAWKPYIPAIGTGVVSVACLIGGQSVSVRRNAALATAYQLSTTALNEYKEKVVETVGEATAKEVRDKVIQEKQERISESTPTIIITGDDDVLIFEELSNQEFKSTTIKVEKAMIELNKRLTCGSEYCVSLNEFLNELGLKNSPIGNDIGWTASKLIDFTFDVETNDKGKPRLKIAYLTPPEYGYRDYY